MSAFIVIVSWALFCRLSVILAAIVFLIGLAGGRSSASALAACLFGRPGSACNTSAFVILPGACALQRFDVYICALRNLRAAGEILIRSFVGSGCFVWLSCVCSFSFPMRQMTVPGGTPSPSDTWMSNTVPFAGDSISISIFRNLCWQCFLLFQRLPRLFIPDGNRTFFHRHPQFRHDHFDSHVLLSFPIFTPYVLMFLRASQARCSRLFRRRQIQVFKRR